MCLTPYRFRDQLGHLQEVNCQKCPECRNHISKHFAIRCQMECNKSNYKPYFVTLTISNEFYVLSSEEYKQEIIKMIKLMRYDGLKFKYILSIEKGDKTGRLHSHLIFMINESRLDVINIINTYYLLGGIKVTEALYKDIHYVVAYIYDGVLYRTFSKGLGKFENKYALLKYFIQSDFEDIPLYFRRKVQNYFPEQYKKKYGEYIYSYRSLENYKKVRSDEYKDIKFQKLLQIKFAMENYKIPVVSIPIQK